MPRRGACSIGHATAAPGPRPWAASRSPMAHSRLLRPATRRGAAYQTRPRCGPRRLCRPCRRFVTCRIHASRATRSHGRTRTCQRIPCLPRAGARKRRRVWATMCIRRRRQRSVTGESRRLRSAPRARGPSRHPRRSCVLLWTQRRPVLRCPYPPPRRYRRHRSPDSLRRSRRRGA